MTYCPLFSEEDFARLYIPRARVEKVLRTARGFARRTLQLRLAARSDVIVLYREAFPLGGPLFEQILAARRPLVFDFDDAIWLGDTSEFNAWIRRYKRPDKTADIVACSTITTVGNDYLAAYSSRYSAAVRVLPTTIDVERYRPQPHEPRPRVRIGWSGSPTTSRYLIELAPVLREVLQRGDVELYVVGDPRFQLHGTPNVISRPWSRHSEVADVSAFDIGIMPMPDDPWTRGKCGFKALLYMSFGVPAIASPVGVNSSIIQHGRNGLLASSTDEWARALHALIDSAELRRRLGTNGRETVISGYSGQQWAPQFYEILCEAAARGA